MKTKAIKIEDLRSKKYDQNIRKEGEDSDTCVLCGKRTKSQVMIHINTDLELIAADDESTPEHEDQGCFVVGSECLKKVPVAYLINPGKKAQKEAEETLLEAKKAQMLAWYKGNPIKEAININRLESMALVSRSTFQRFFNGGTLANHHVSTLYGLLSCLGFRFTPPMEHVWSDKPITE